jgi:hypothetical protein
LVARLEEILKNFSFDFVFEKNEKFSPPLQKNLNLK